MKGRLRLLLALSTALPVYGAAWAAPAPGPAAEPADITVITTTATRTPKMAASVPATVTVKTAEEMADTLTTDIKDLVRFEPGVSVRRSPARFGAALGATGRDGNSGFNIRGIEGNRVLIQVDGVRVPDGFGFGAQSAGRGDYVDLGVIKAVEILRGPTSALYGSDGLSGVVSFITSDPADFITDGNTWGGLVRAAYSSADTQFSETAIVAGRAGDLSAMLAYTRRDGEELKNQGTDTSPNSNRTAPNPQDSQSNALLGKVVWQANEAHRFRLTLDHLDSDVDTHVLSGIAPAATAPTSVLDLTAEDETERNRISLDWRYAGSGALQSSTLTLWYQDAENIQRTYEDRNTADDRSRINTFENRVMGLSAELHSGFETGGLAHHVVYGGDLSVTRQKGLRDGTVPTPPDFFPTRAFPVTDYTLAGLYVADEIGLGDVPLTLYPTLRFDYYDLSPKNDPLLPGFVAASQSDSHVSPKIGAVWELPQGFNVFASYAGGFKAPSPTQVNQFFENPTSPFFAYKTIANPDLKPETSRAWEGGLRWLGDEWNASLSAFMGRFKDFISQEQVGGTGSVADPLLFQFINLDRVRIKGVEGKLTGKTAMGLTADVAFSYAKGNVIDQTGTRTPLSSVDPFKLVGGIGYRDLSDMFGGQFIATYSAKKALDRTTGACTGDCFRPNAFTIFDITAFYRLTDMFTVRAAVFNLFDKKYAWWSDVSGLADTSTVGDAYTQPGRNVSVSLSAKF